MKKFLLIILLVCAGGTFMWASGSQESAGSKTLRVMCVYTPDHSVGPAVEAINQIFAETHPDITIEMQTMPADNLRQVLRTDFDSGNPPAVFNIWQANTNLDFVEGNRWLDLSEALAADTGWRDNFNGGALDVHSYGTDGVCGVPQASFALGMYYNKELFAKAGITSAPETMEEFLSAIEKLNTLDGITPMPLGNLDTWRALHLFAAVFYKLNGTDAAASAAERTIRHDGSEIIKTYEFMQTLVESGAFGKNFEGLGYADEVSMYNEGRSAIRFSGTWTLGEVSEDIDTGFFPFPYFADKPQYQNDWFAGYADGWGIASGMDPVLEQAAIDYVKLWTGAEGSKIFAEVAKNIPAAKADVDSAKTGELFASVVNMMGAIEKSEVDFATPEKETIVQDQIAANAQAVLAGAMTPSEAAAMLQSVVDSTK